MVWWENNDDISKLSDEIISMLVEVYLRIPWGFIYFESNEFENRAG